MNKFYNEKTFDLPGGLRARCRTQNTSYGFRHLATIFKDYSQISTGKCTYSNRTWERFNYESVIRSGLNNADLTAEEREAANNWLESYEEGSPFKTVSMIAVIGDLLEPDQKSRNDWKKRMMQAGLPGIDFPSDWDQLSENEKQRRIDGALKNIE